MKKYMNDAYTLLHKIDIKEINSFERILTWISYSQGRIDYSKIYKKKKNENISIKIWFPNVANEFMEFKIDSQATVGDVMIMIAKEFRLHCIDDFGLFL